MIIVHIRVIVDHSQTEHYECRVNSGTNDLNNLSKFLVLLEITWNQITSLLHMTISLTLWCCVCGFQLKKIKKLTISIDWEGQVYHSVSRFSQNARLS